MSKISKITASLIIAIILAQATQPVLAAPNKPKSYEVESRALYDSRLNVVPLLKLQNLKRSGQYEAIMRRDYVNYLTVGVTGMSDYVRPMVYFVAYGTPSTKHFGYRDRSGVLNSYTKAFGHLPLSRLDWSDVVSIANGWPPVTKSLQAEQSARKEFRKAYGREPVLKSDASAILMMAYGVRPAKKIKSLEQKALAHFQVVYGFAPVYGYQWDVLRAFAYSGVK